MLEELAKNDKEWRRMAYHICRCKSLADDLVQDMYLHLSKYNKPLNEYYVYFAIKQIYIRKLQRRKLDTVELTDNYITFTDSYDYELDETKEAMLKKVAQLPYFERELLKVTQEISQRELSRQTKINLVVIQKTIQKTKLKLWQNVKK